MMRKTPLRVGIDFDGVLAYNPFRVARAPVTVIKRAVFGMKRTKFYIPKTPIERAIWTILHESSVFPAQGDALLRTLVNDRVIEAHLVTARYHFLQEPLYRWLERHDMKRFFKSITLNTKDEQPHSYKARVVTEKKFDYFIEDNLDVVTHVTKKTPTRVLWIYNILDRGVVYPYKYPYLGKALQAIVDQQKKK